MHFQILLILESVAGFGWVLFNELGGSWRKEMFLLRFYLHGTVMWHGNATVESQWKNPEIWPHVIRKRVTRWSPKCAWMIKSWIPTAMQNFITIQWADFAHPHICEVAYWVFTRLVFGGSSNSLPPSPLRRFWRSIRRKTSFRARMCLWGPEIKILHFDAIFFKKRKFSVDFRREKFGPKRALTRRVHIKTKIYDSHK